MDAAQRLAPETCLKAACGALAVPRAALYRWRRRAQARTPAEPQRRSPPRALTAKEREEVFAVLHSERFVDQAPHQAYATLLDEGRCQCSIRTMYRSLEANGESKERRDQLRLPSYHKPELLAQKPNEVWSWDITKLRGPAKWTDFHPYMILGIFSRYVVGWMVADRESAALAQQPSRNRSSKRAWTSRPSRQDSSPVATLLADLGVTKTHSRPHTSDDNLFSDAQFKTLKYRPDFPDRFGSIEDAHRFCRPLFHCYNHQHRHSGIALLTPAVVHHGQAQTALAARAAVLQQPHKAHPEGFVGKWPVPGPLPQAVWFNPPKPTDAGGELP